MGSKGEKKLIFKLTPLIVTICLMVSLCGCAATDFAVKIGREIASGVSTAVDSIKGDESTDSEEEDDTEDLSDILSPGGKFGYSKLTKKEKKTYKKIEKAIGKHDDLVHRLDISDEDTLFKIVDYVAMDHPEYFWWETGGTIRISSLLGAEIDVCMEFDYTLTKEEADEYSEQIVSVVDAFTSSIPSDATEYEKVLQTYEYIIKNTDYNLDAPYNQTIMSVLLGRESVCSGYSKTMQYLLMELGVFCTNITGHVKDGRSHSWNLVGIDGEYYYVDPTWGDPVFTADMEDEMLETTVSYDYFCVTTEEIKKTHSFNYEEIMPLCISNAYNYFNVNGWYFTDYSVESIQTIINNAVAVGKPFVAVKFASQSVYWQAYNSLLTGRSIFTLMKNAKQDVNKSLQTNSLSYTVNEELSIIKLSFDYI